MIAALEPRIKATVTVGWMTTGDTQQAYNLAGAIGTFCLLPGVWNRLDIPDLISMGAPKACMVVSGTEDLSVSSSWTKGSSTPDQPMLFPGPEFPIISRAILLQKNIATTRTFRRKLCHGLIYI